MRMLLVAALAVTLGGCATGYGKTGLTGGYWDKPGPGELVEVGFDGNGYIAQDTVEMYLLFRSAEIAKLRGKPYFRIYHTLRHAIMDSAMIQADGSSLGGKPYGKVYMLLDDGPVAGALNTDEILARYAAKVKGAQAAAASGGKS
jgi:hypothetical protein